MKNLTVYFLLLSLTAFWGCGSSKKSFQTGDYYTAVMKAVSKLKKNPNNKKSGEVLRQAYPMAVKYYLDEAERMEAGNDRFKNGNIYDAYQKLSNIYDEIRRSPGALRIIPDPKDYYDRLKYYAREAAGERYTAGEEALALGGRQNAMVAYEHFAKADMYLPGYLDVKDKIEEARYKATLKVLVRQIPVPSFQAGLSAQFFQDQIEQYLFNYKDNEFVRFYSERDQNLKDPDQILILQFDDFVVGQMNTREKIMEVTKDSVIMGKVPKSSLGNQEQKIVICHTDPANKQVKQTLEVSVSALQKHLDHGDKIGPCNGDKGRTSQTRKEEYVNVYGTAKATFRENIREVVSRGLLSMQIIDTQSNTVVFHEKFPGEFVWTNRWGSFNGDERALTEEQLQIARQQPVMPPPPQTLFIEFCRPIYSQLIRKIKKIYRDM